MKIVVIGGAGYIGSHVVRYLRKKHSIKVFDSLVHGKREFVPEDVEFIKADLSEYEKLKQALKGVDVVIHLAGFIEVGESMKNPYKFIYNNNVLSLNILRAMAELNVKNIIFSSSAAVYGEPEKIPILEEHRKKPVNCYGDTKLIFEKYLHWFHLAHGINYVIFRYFNAAGADPSGEIGEAHEPETHLIPLIFQVVEGLRKDIKIFGSDYDTPDGTCIRDYIHVNDIASAHELALPFLMRGNSDCFNLGIGKGFSVREVIDAVKEVTRKPIKVVEAERRPGDPAVLLASPEKAKRILNWQPLYTDIKDIVRTAWYWEKKKNLIKEKT